MKGNLIKKGAVLAIIALMSTNTFAAEIKGPVLNAGTDTAELSETEKYFLKLPNGTEIDPLLPDAFFSVNDKTDYKNFCLKKGSNDYVPLRAFMEAIGGSLIWDNITHNITIQKDNLSIMYFNDKPFALVNGSEKSLEHMNFKENSITYADLDFLADNLGLYYETTEGIIIPEEDREAFEIEKKNIPEILISEKKDLVKWAPSNKKGLEIPETILKAFDEVNFNEDETFIYNNFPEAILSNAYSETYINKTENVEGDGRVFASHANNSGKYIDYIVRIKNNQSESVSFSYLLDSGISDSGGTSQSVVEPHLKSFYGKKLNEEYEISEIPAKGFLDIPVTYIPHNGFVTFIMDFTAESEVDIISFVVEHKGETNFYNYATPNIEYDYDYVPKTYKASPDGLLPERMYYSVYSGFAKGYSINTESVIKASELTENNLGFETGSGGPNNLNELEGKKEIQEITLTSPRGNSNEIKKAMWVGNVPYEKEVDRKNKDLFKNYTNLGNWGMEYNINTLLLNDTSEEKTFKLNILVPQYSPIAIVSDESIFTLTDNNRDLFHTLSRNVLDNQARIKVNNKISVWEMMEVTLPPFAEKEIDYLYTLGTDGNSSVYHIWEITNE